MSQVITNAFENYWQSCLTAEQPVVLDEFILADIPNLDITSPIDPDAGLPPESQIVHRQNVDQRGRINNNAVAYTIVMDTTVGDFSFNAMYLRNKQLGVIGMIVYKGRETKLKTDQATGQTGNSLVKSMLMGYDQAAEATLTHVDAGTWQIDYAARLRGMDEDIRKLQADIYGNHTFVNDAFKVVKKDDTYQVSQGVAIVGGLRVEMNAPEVIHPGTKPIGVWVDVHRAGSLLSEHQNHFTIITSVADLTDHVDNNGYQHYVAKLATVQVNGAVVDERKGEGVFSDTEELKSTLMSDFDDMMFHGSFLFMFADQMLPLYVSNLFENRSDAKSHIVNFGCANKDGGVFSVESDTALMLDAKKIPFPVPKDKAYLTARLKFHEVDTRQKRQIVFRKVAPTAAVDNNLKYMVIGDSNTNIAFADLLNNIMRARGHNPKFIGTIKGQKLDASDEGPLGEGRSGWASADFTHRNSRRKSVPIGSESSYLVMGKSEKNNVNPFIVPSNEKDSFNGYRFNFSSYLERFSLDTPDVVGIGLGPNNLYLDGTPEQIAECFIDDIRIMVDSIWEANPDAKIALYLRGVSKTVAQDGRIIGHRWLQKKLIEFTRSHPKHNAGLWLISSWAYMSQEAGYRISGGANSVGVVDGGIADDVHQVIDEAERAQYVATVAPWMCWVSYESHLSGYRAEPMHEMISGKRGAAVGTAQDVFNVPVRQMSGGTAGGTTFLISRYDNSVFGSYTVLGKSRGSEQLPLPVVRNDSLGKYSWAGYDGSNFMIASTIDSYVDGEVVEGKHVPSAIRFSVVTDSGKESLTAMRMRNDGSIEAGFDAKQPLGTATKRWSVVFSESPAISTSDEREKSSLVDIGDDILDAWGDVDWSNKFRFKNAIERKGEDGARWHFGLIAQRVKDAFENRGIDPMEFGLLCYDKWGHVSEQISEDGRVIEPALCAGDRYGIRYEEALSIEAAYQRRNYLRILKRVEMLEAKYK